MTTAQPDEPEFPPELARCTCGARSFDTSDHANTCRLGTTPPRSSEPRATTAELLPSESRF